VFMASWRHSTNGTMQNYKKEAPRGTQHKDWRKSVNRSQIYIEHIKHVIFEPENTYFSTYPPPTLIHLSHRFTSASKPAAQKSFEVLSQPLPRPVRHQLQLSNALERISQPSCWTALSDKHFPPQTGNISLWISFTLTIEGCSSVVYFSSTGPHFDYWNLPLNMCMHVCYLDVH
jgi:hypothetical protein